VTDTISENGSGNKLTNDFFGMIAPVTGGSTINFIVNGSGGGNTVDLTQSSGSTINVTANGIGGSNTVTIGNSGGVNTVSLGGLFDHVTLNGDATNTVSFGAGSATVRIGNPPVPGDDDLFTWPSTVNFSGTGNTLFGGDENFMVSGSTGFSTVHVGDGENNISMGGSHNIVSVWGGDNQIDAGGGASTVTILGLDGTGAATPTDPDGPDDGLVPLSPTDNVTIAGSLDSVTTTYENVNVWGLTASAATIHLGNGNNSVILQGAGGGNHVTVGNGGNTINARGNGNIINVGDGVTACRLRNRRHRPSGPCRGLGDRDGTRPDHRHPNRAERRYGQSARGNRPHHAGRRQRHGHRQLQLDHGRGRQRQQQRHRQRGRRHHHPRAPRVWQ
jgi:hypothetical protein